MPGPPCLSKKVVLPSRTYCAPYSHQDHPSIQNIQVFSGARNAQIISLNNALFFRLALRLNEPSHAKTIFVIVILKDCPALLSLGMTLVVTSCWQIDWISKEAPIHSCLISTLQQVFSTKLYIMESEILWDILIFPNWESGTASFTWLESGKAFESGKGSGSQSSFSDQTSNYYGCTWLQLALPESKALPDSQFGNFRMSQSIDMWTYIRPTIAVISTFTPVFILGVITWVSAHNDWSNWNEYP